MKAQNKNPENGEHLEDPFLNMEDGLWNLEDRILSLEKQLLQMKISILGQSNQILRVKTYMLRAETQKLRYDNQVLSVDNQILRQAETNKRNEIRNETATDFHDNDFVTCLTEHEEALVKKIEMKQRMQYQE